MEAKKVKTLKNGYYLFTIKNSDYKFRKYVLHNEVLTPKLSGYQEIYIIEPLKDFIKTRNISEIKTIKL